jgi:hypothetical protein
VKVKGERTRRKMKGFYPGTHRKEMAGKLREKRV